MLAARAAATSSGESDMVLSRIPATFMSMSVFHQFVLPLRVDDAFKAISCRSFFFADLLRSFMDEGEQGMFDIGHDIADEARSGVLSLGEKRVSAGGCSPVL